MKKLKSEVVWRKHQVTTNGFTGKSKHVVIIYELSHDGETWTEVNYDTMRNNDDKPLYKYSRTIKTITYN